MLWAASNNMYSWGMDQIMTPRSQKLDADDIPLSIVAGPYHICICLQDKKLIKCCFGWNDYGQLAIGIDSKEELEPEFVIVFCI